MFGWGDDAFGKSFAVLIQLGAILALLTIYFGRLWALATEMFTQWAAARFVIGVLLAFLPAAVVGALAYHIIKSYLFDVRIVCVSLIIGGFVLLWVDRMNLKARYHEATGFPLLMYFGIGLIQCISMTSGVSRVESGKNGQGRVQGLFQPGSSGPDLKPGGSGAAQGPRPTSPVRPF